MLSLLGVINVTIPSLSFICFLLVPPLLCSAWSLLSGKIKHWKICSQDTVVSYNKDSRHYRANEDFNIVTTFLNCAVSTSSPKNLALLNDRSQGRIKEGMRGGLNPPRNIFMSLN